ncbi:MAG: hypothetical protein QN152_09160 [Armatimonadota bacterium]|nr:hypothetical protein [Armatimonadota bacterium]MDR7427805.1 hypothetical protein [Armatimonadota bacterium]MDR7463122.1 hypothetical protein [Armatimonadota bacterium]MDR7468891.1 hypothetical protein [Armatimonadota bacterium]MDR7474868.1 hypothetical protein [Armatimonadota bacterium]
MAVVVVALLLLNALVHSVWLVRLPLWGQVADPAIPLIVAVALRRPGWGPLVGLGAGLLQDLLFGGSVGLVALAKLVVGQVAGVLGRTVLVDQPLLPWAITALATVLHQGALAAVLAVTGLLPVSPAIFGRPLLGQVALNLLAVWPAFAAVRWLWPGPRAAPKRERPHAL